VKTVAKSENGLSILWQHERFQYFSPKCVQRSFLVHANSEPAIIFNAQDFLEFYRYMSIDVLVTPDVIYTEEALKNLDPIVRQCYFDGEKNLKLFNTYTKRNCEAECLAFKAHDHCGCVPFYVIRNRTMNVCDLRGWKCSLQYRALVLENECNCLPQCNTITYNFVKIESRLDENFMDEKVAK
jgi:hypothetical protein